MIRFNALSFAYSRHASLIEELDLQVAEGSLFGLLGPNGAGKTTLIKLATGLLSPRSGSLSVAGMDYRRQRRAIQGLSAVVPQDYAFYPQLSVQENLAFYQPLYGGRGRPAGQALDEALGLTGLGERRAERAGNLSGGMKRRLNLAIGLLNRPRLLFLDEPTVGIDPQSRHFILEAIRELNRAGTTVVYTTHYMEEVEQLCDRVAIMDHGRILALGTLEALLHKPRALHLRLERELSQRPLPERLQAAVAGHGLTCCGRDIGGVIPTNREVAELVDLFEREGIGLTGYHYGRQTLESLFFDLTATHLRD